MRCKIKAMTLADYEDVLRLWQSSEGVGLSESDSRAAIANFLKRNRGMSFVARDGKEVVGAVLCGHDGRRGCLYHLAVAPSHRRIGLGSTLVARCEAELRRCGILKCNVFVYHQNAAGARFWLMKGWKKRVELCMAQKDLNPSRTRAGGKVRRRVESK
jgi:ribosomal protein S18 acetylase RimI-like enzyme